MLFPTTHDNDVARSTVARSVVDELVSAAVPHDECEARHQADILAWVRSGAQLFRLDAPDNPARHMCVYFALLADDSRPRVLMVDHLKAGLWLLPGGHVDEDEDPRATVVREADEELGITADFDPRFGDRPLFVTVTETRGTGSHTDVTLWFVIKAVGYGEVRVDPREARSARWFELADTDVWAGDRFDPHMARFRDKLLSGISERQLTLV